MSARIAPAEQSLSRGRRFRNRLRRIFLILAPILGMAALVYVLFPPSPINILILGVDGRGGEGALSRADSIMILRFDPARLNMSLLSIPRDLFVEVPSFGQQRVNTVNLLGEQQAPGSGMTLTAAAVQATFGIPVQRHVRLNFEGFVGLIDAVGGVTIDVERVIEDTQYPAPDGGVMTVRFDVGLQDMNGERALIYARTRQADDDYYRAGRQQQVLTALLGRALNPLRWPAVLGTLNGVITTDLNLGDFLAAAPVVLLNGGRAHQLVLDRNYIRGTAAGHAIPDLERIRPWLAEHFPDAVVPVN